MESLESKENETVAEKVSDRWFRFGRCKNYVPLFQYWDSRILLFVFDKINW